MMFRRGKGYIRLWERQKFPSKQWLRRMVKSHSRTWVIDTFGHMSYGGMLGTGIAVISYIFLGITFQQFAGLSGISWACDLTFSGTTETLYVNALHRKWGAVRTI